MNTNTNRPTLAGYVAFSGRQAIGTDTNPDRLLETLLETHDPEQFDVRGVTQDVLDAVADGDDCPDVVLADVGPDGRVYSLR